MRASTAFCRILGIPGIRVGDVAIQENRVVVEVALTAKVPRCGACGTKAAATYDHRRRRRWRHLDCFGWRVELCADLRRVACGTCQAVRTEAVPFARPGARHTTAFETAVIWAAVHMDKAAAATLWRVGWATVDAIVARAVGAPRRPTRLRAIGVDERSWRRGRALTVVVDHDTGAVIWAAEGTAKATLEAFFDWIGPEVASGIELVSLDMGRAYIAAVAARAPQARICFDPFHVVRIVNKALDIARRSLVGGIVGLNEASRRRLRFTLARSSRTLSHSEVELLDLIADRRRELYELWMLKEELADLYRLVEPEAAGDYLGAWVARARAARHPAMRRAAETVAAHFDGVVAAVETGLSNSRLEGFNAKIALINRRGYGHRNLTAFLKTVHLACGGVARPTSPWPMAP